MPVPVPPTLTSPQLKKLLEKFVYFFKYIYLINNIILILLFIGFIKMLFTHILAKKIYIYTCFNKKQSI
jgi:hypothetical protein